MDTQHYLHKFVELFKSELLDNLVGIYLHGSLAMSCFNPKRSDVDLIIVVRDKLSKETARRIITKTLDLHDEMTNARGIEFSIILEKILFPFEYPTPFELHYSELHRERYLLDEEYICGGFNDEDLASQLMVAYHRGITLYGKPFIDLCPPIDRKYYIASIYHDIKNAKQDVMSDSTLVTNDPVYIVLNLCRVLYYLKEDQISSKKEGGEWGITTLPKEYEELIRLCLNNYMGLTDENVIDQQKLLSFIDYMLEEITRYMPDSRSTQ